jgi:hypothetical protein
MTRTNAPWDIMPHWHLSLLGCEPRGAVRQWCSGVRSRLKRTVGMVCGKAWRAEKTCVESGISGSIREYQESRSRMGVSGVPDIRESGPTGYPGYLRDIRNQDQGWGYQVLSLISLIQHRKRRGRCVSDTVCVRLSTADGFRRDVHVDIRRKARRQTRPIST